MSGIREPRFDPEAHRRFAEDVAYFYENFTKIRGQYPDRYVAIADKVIISKSRNLELLILKLDGIEADLGNTYINNTFSPEEREMGYQQTRALAGAFGFVVKR